MRHRIRDVRRILGWVGLTIVVGAAGVAATGCGGKIVVLGEDRPNMANCTISRSECLGFVTDANGNATCPDQNLIQVPDFQVTSPCYFNQPGATDFFNAFEACNAYCNELYDLDNENCAATVVNFGTADPGVCEPVSGASNGKTARATCTRGGRPCTATQTVNGKTVCTNQANPVTETADACFDPTKLGGGFNACANNYTSTTPGVGVFNEPRVDITNVQLNSSLCQPTTTTGSALTYGVAPGAVGTATIGGVTSALTANGGSIAVKGSCIGSNCTVSALNSLRVTFANMVVQGTTVANLEADLAAPAPIVTTNGVLTIAKANFLLALSASIPGGTTEMQVTPTQDVVLKLNAQTVSFTAPFSALPVATDNTVVPVSVSVNLPASSTNPGGACTGFTPLQTLLGFEDLGWTSTQASLSLSPTLHTQGCFGLNVAGSGYMVVNSARFATPMPGVKSTLALDVFVPTGQPNPFWLGAVQLYASCPSAGMNNAYLGQAELTGKPTGAFSTVTYAAPSNVKATLLQSHNDCFFSVAVNVNATPTPVVLDNLRFQ